MGKEGGWLKNLLKCMKKGKEKTDKNTPVSVETKVKKTKKGSNRFNHDAGTREDYDREAVSGLVRVQNRAAVKIQAVFRGFLARKALRALRGLVRLQALVRGRIVRKNFAETLHTMQAILRGQTTFSSRNVQSSHNRDHMIRSRKPIEKGVYNRRSSSYRHDNPYCDYDCRLMEAESTPRLSSCSRRANVASKKLLCDDCSSTSPNYFEGPSYMATTKSFREKLRCQSAPKQRPDPGSRASFGSKNAEVLFSSSGRF